MPRFDRLLTTGMALAAAAAFTLTGCTQKPEEAAKDAATATGDAAKQAATATGEASQKAASAAGDAAKKVATAADQAALAPAVNPVLDLLKKSESSVKGGNVAAAIAAMGGFKALWDKASPVIQPLAGDKWPAINTAANLVSSTFGAGAKPDAAAAGSALTGLIGPLSGLIGK